MDVAIQGETGTLAHQKDLDFLVKNFDSGG